MEDDNDFNEIEDVDEELTEEPEAVDNEYDGSFSYGPKVDQGLVKRMQNIRSSMQNNFGGPRDQKQKDDGNETSGGGNKSLDKKDGLNKDESSPEKNTGDTGKSKGGDGLTPEINNNEAQELGSKIASGTSKNIAQEVGGEAAKKVGEEAAKEVAKDTVKGVAKTTAGKGLLLVVGKWVAIILLIILGIFFLVSFFSYAYESLIGSISSFFGISENTTEEGATENKDDGLLTANKYQYYRKGTCDLDNYSEGKCSCSPGEANCVALTHEDLVKVLKSEDKCKIDNKFYQFWDDIIYGLGGEPDTECKLLRYIRGAVSRYEDEYKGYNLKLDNGLVVSSILNIYGSQNRDFAKENTSTNTAFVEDINHYEMLSNIAEDGLVTKKEVDSIIKSTILEDIYPYYVYKDEACELRAHVDYKLSFEKWQIFMRYGDGTNNSLLGVNDKDFSAVGYISIGTKRALERKINETTVLSHVTPDISGSGWVYYRSLNNAWNQSSEECRTEEFFTDRNMTGPKDISIFEQKVEDVYGRGTFSPMNATVDYRIDGRNRSANITTDYRAGFVFNKATMFKKAIESGKTAYDSLSVPKEVEKVIQETLDRKKEVNEVLFFENEESTILSEPVQTPEYVESNKFFWPIGSNETTTVDGVTLATGKPASTSITSYYGKRKHPRTGEYKMHYGVDISGKEGSTNVIAAQGGKVVQVKNGCSPGNYGCGGGYGNYIKIQHSDGKYTLYAHLHKGSLKVTKGSQVLQGQVIAKVGNTGNSTGPHLHFEVRVSSTKRVNPLDYIDKKEPRPSASESVALNINNNKNLSFPTLLSSSIFIGNTLGMGTLIRR